MPLAQEAAAEYPYALGIVCPATMPPPTAGTSSLHWAVNVPASPAERLDMISIPSWIPSG